MERFLMRDLEAWRENPCRKPLIINGARQVGKTWLIKEFGRRHYKSVAYVNMDNNSAMRELFDTGYDIDVYREVEEEDVALTEFADEIDGWIIDALKSVGCDSAKSVLELPVEEIAARADLELEQAQKVVAILKAEFEE